MEKRTSSDDDDEEESASRSRRTVVLVAFLDFAVAAAAFIVLYESSLSPRDVGRVVGLLAAWGFLALCVGCELEFAVGVRRTLGLLTSLAVVLGWLTGRIRVGADRPFAWVAIVEVALGSVACHRWLGGRNARAKVRTRSDLGANARRPGDRG